MSQTSHDYERRNSVYRTGDNFADLSLVKYAAPISRHTVAVLLRYRTRNLDLDRCFVVEFGGGCNIFVKKEYRNHNAIGTRSPNQNLKEG